jgi:hypothetical protein
MHRKLMMSVIALSVLGASADAQQPDYSLVLVPLDYGFVVPGAYGSEWNADLWVANHSDVPVSTNVCSFPPGCPIGSGQSPEIPARQAFQNPFNIIKERDPGVVWFLSPGDSEKLQFSLRLYEKSNNLVRQGIEVPVVREREFFTRPLELLNVPMGESQRVAVRIYDPDAAHPDETIAPREKFVRVEVVTNEHLREPTVLFDAVLAFPVSHRTFEESVFEPAVIELLSLRELVGAAESTSVRVRVTPITADLRIWAMASVTDNETQYVTIISPQ